MRIVLDTNVVVSGLLHSQGNPAQVLALALAGAVHVLHDPRILAEYAEVLARPRFKLDPDRVHDVLTKVKLDGIGIQPGQQTLELPDANDEPFLAVALAGAADYLVTGNLADYPEEKRRGCAVVSPAEFMRTWGQRQPEPPPATQ
jgi:putative PIN family toxin of toxin-antitoxin system